MGRGRRPCDDILTPREWEVLELIRQGLTNEKIASRLGITEGGAKFHVSEILGKLGVENRHQAASWERQPTRRWALSFPFALHSPIHLGAKFALATACSLSVLVIVGLEFGGHPIVSRIDFAQAVAGGGGGPSDDAKATQPVLRTGTFDRVSADSWDELEGLTDFSILKPGLVPAGFELRDLSLQYMGSPTTTFPTIRNGIILATYASDDGFLQFYQGWGVGLPSEPIPGHIPHGEVDVGGQRATWIEGRRAGGVGPPGGNRPDEAYLRLGWFPDPHGATGPGWRLATDSLSLEELVNFASSLE